MKDTCEDRKVFPPPSLRWDERMHGIVVGNMVTLLQLWIARGCGFSARTHRGARGAEGNVDEPWTERGRAAMEILPWCLGQSRPRTLTWHRCPSGAHSGTKDPARLHSYPCGRADARMHTWAFKETLPCQLSMHWLQFGTPSMYRRSRIETCLRPCLQVSTCLLRCSVWCGGNRQEGAPTASRTIFKCANQVARVSQERY